MDGFALQFLLAEPRRGALQWRGLPQEAVEGRWRGGGGGGRGGEAKLASMYLAHGSSSSCGTCAINQSSSAAGLRNPITKSVLV